MQKIIQKNKTVYRKTKKQLSFHDIEQAKNIVKKVDIDNLRISSHAIKKLKERDVSIDDVRGTLHAYNVCEISLNETEFNDSKRVLIRGKKALNGLQTCLIIDEVGLIITVWKIPLWKKQLKRISI